MWDVRQLRVRGGRGGNGSLHFRREKRLPEGGPDGGDGGDGGAVIFVARSNVDSLDALGRVAVIAAEDGRNGGGSNKTGGRGAERIVDVPVGTVVWDVGTKGKRELVADLAQEGTAAVVARGGAGGKGNLRFATSTNRTPRLAEGGEAGEIREAFLEVKTLGDVAIVGAPSAGKSTFLRAVSRARPDVGAYAFTTTAPVAGVVNHGDRRLVFIEVPGLIRDAHLGKGLGLEFLRHADRARALLVLVDGAEADLVEALASIDRELGAYGKSLAAKPRVFAVGKQDLPEAREGFAAQRLALEAAAGAHVWPISGATGEGVGALLDAVSAAVPLEAPGAVPVLAQPSAPAPRGDRRLTPIRVARDSNGFLVSCAPAERLVAVSDLRHWQARMQLHRELDRLGVLRALLRAGVHAGDTVRIGRAEMEWS